MFTISKEIQDIESTDTPGDSNKNVFFFFIRRKIQQLGCSHEQKNIFWNLKPSNPEEFTV